MGKRQSTVRVWLLFFYMILCHSPAWIEAFVGSRSPAIAGLGRGGAKSSAAILQSSLASKISSWPRTPRRRDEILCSTLRRRNLRLQATLVAPTAPSVLIKSAAAILVASILLVTNKRRNKKSWLWPSSEADPSFEEPLPPGTFGCPFVGFNILGGSRKGGPEHFYYKQSESLGHPQLWKFYFLGRPVVNLTGVAMVKQFLNREFDGTVGAKPPTDAEMEKRMKRMTIYNVENIAYERNRDKHSFLRRLIGAGIQNSKPLPMLRRAARDCIDRMQSRADDDTEQGKETIRMHDFATDYTLEFVQTKLLGITDNLTNEDRKRVREELEIWMDGLNSFLLAMNLPFVNRLSKPYKARQFLQQKIEEKMDLLEKDGRPDGSILSSMLFAEEDENGEENKKNSDAVVAPKKLTRSQVLGNVLFLVAAGAETTASTLTLAILFLGLHPKKYQKLVEEQEKFQNQEVTEEQLSQEQSPYLDAIIKETMRMGPVSGVFPRRLRKTVIINGDNDDGQKYQIPKGWSILGAIRLTHQLDPVTWEPNQAHMDPMKGFRPERWLVEDPDDRPKEYIPFGAGPRFCLGANLALLELKVFLATWARSVPTYSLPNLEGAERKGIEWNSRSIVPRPADGVVVEIPQTAQK